MAGTQETRLSPRVLLSQCESDFAALEGVGRVIDGVIEPGSRDLADAGDFKPSVGLMDGRSPTVKVSIPRLVNMSLARSSFALRSLTVAAATAAYGRHARNAA